MFTSLLNPETIMSSSVSSDGSPISKYQKGESYGALYDGWWNWKVKKMDHSTINLQAAPESRSHPVKPWPEKLRTPTGENRALLLNCIYPNNPQLSLVQKDWCNKTLRAKAVYMTYIKYMYIYIYICIRVCVCHAYIYIYVYKCVRVCELSTVGNCLDLYVRVSHSSPWCPSNTRPIAWFSIQKALLQNGGVLGERQTIQGQKERLCWCHTWIVWYWYPVISSDTNVQPPAWRPCYNVIKLPRSSRL